MSRSPLSVVIVDDEVLALDLLELYVERNPSISLVARFQSAPQALEYITETPPDILLLDIQMPSLSGLNLLKSLKHPPATIFTTAYANHALEAYDLDVVDYLLKPFSNDRFLRAISKAREQLRKAPTALQPVQDSITIKVDGNLVRLKIDEILFLEGYREYVKIHTFDGVNLVLDRLHKLESALPKGRFVRVHKSYIVSAMHVKSLQGNQLQVGASLVPISRRLKESVVEQLF